MEEKKYSEENAQKKRHPLEKANIITKTFFCWLLPYFVKGFKKELNEDDMYGPLSSHEANTLGNKLEKIWQYETTHNKIPSLWMAIIKMFKVEIVILLVYFMILEIGIKISQPLLISKFLKFYEPNQTEMTKNEACIYAALIVLVSLLVVLGGHSYFLRAQHMAMKIRVAVCSLIYRKALRLNKSALAETTIGQMVNLISNDVGRLDRIAILIHYLWLGPVETIIIMYLVYTSVGFTGLIGTGFLILFIPFSMYMGQRTSHFRLKTAKRTDERVRLMSEIITGIQVIKMYTWEKPFAKLVQLARKTEMQQVRATSVIRALIISFNLILNRVAIYLCVLTYVLTGNIINASYAYTIISYYAILQVSVIAVFPLAVTQFAETAVSIKRIQKFLLFEEMQLDTESSIAVKNTEKINSRRVPILNTNIVFKEKIKNKPVGIYLDNVSVKWIQSLPNYALENITLNANYNQLVAVVGPVGGGKSTLLQVILKELPPIEGSVEVVGTLSYASQEPWLFGGTVRQNIIFGQEFMEEKYKKVVGVCALERDFTLFPYGDLTLVGDRGVTLSGGQRARINLARAVYKDADIYLLDDPLSAVDTHVGKQLFNECICGYLKDKCVVLVTHQLQYLKHIQNIYLLEDGKVEASGSYKELQATDGEFTKLLTDNEGGEDEKSKRKSKLVIEETDTEEATQDAQLQEREERGSGGISWHVYKSYLRAGGSWFKTVLLCLAFIICQIFASTTDYFLTIWVNVEQWRSLNNVTNFNDAFSEDQNMNNSLQYFLNLILTEKLALIIYSCIVILTAILTLTRSIFFFKYCMTASTKLHNQMFDNIVNASMRFFNSNPPGRILNRFSKDIGILDEFLPQTIIDTFQIGFIVLSISIIIGFLNPWIFLLTIIILIIFYMLRVVYLATSRNIKRVESVARSPIYTHFSTSLQGLTTIRAFGAQEILMKEFDKYQNLNSSAFFMFIAATRTFGFWLDFHCVIYVALLIISILFIEDEIFGGNVGLALTQSITLTGMFQYGMRQWSELENNMTSIERVQEYIDISPEKEDKPKQPPKLWPEHGKIKFDHLCLRYFPDGPYVLNDLSFEIKSKEKVGIVGRTGAGKSSLIAALFRLTDIEGTILIDNMDTKKVQLSSLRAAISIIPQEPVLFSGTLRRNLDPFDEYNDDVLWSSLAEVELKLAVYELPAGLDSKISEGGSNFSVGQRQLLCLARAIIRNNKILVLDEATANVDPHTDGLIQATIRRKFANCTVLTIAHRLHTIMDSDKVLVMDAGKVVEYDHPHNLLLNPNGVFYGLVMQTGQSMAGNLKTIANKSYYDSTETSVT